MTAEEAERRGLTPLARIASFATTGVDPAVMGTGPIPSSRKALEKAGWKAQDLNPEGAVGNAAAATAAKGKAVVDFQARAFVELCRDVDRFDLGRLWSP